MTKRWNGLGIPTDRLRLFPALIALMVLAACGGDDDPVEPDPPVADAIAISPASVTLTSVGETAQFTASVTDQYGDPFTATVTWSSSDNEVFTVSPSGVVTATATGTGTVTAAVGNLSATASVTVNLPAATEISVTPESVTLTSAGETAQFTASVTDQFGDPFPADVTWSSSDTEVFTVNAAGLVTAVADGSGTVTAAVGDLSATASVTVDINLPPMVREGVRTGLTVPMAARGGPLPWLAATRFEDPDDDVLDLTYTVEVGDSAVARAEVVIDSDRNPSVVMYGVGAGTTTLTTTATDPGGLSADVTINLAVADSDYSPLGVLSVGNNKVEIPAISLVGGCSEPLVGFEGGSGYAATIHSAKWQSRADSSSAWTDIAGTEQTDGRLCSYSTQTAGEYRLVMDMTLSLDDNLDPLRGGYRSANTFIVEESTVNRAPELSARARNSMQLSVGGGPDWVVPGAHFNDPDGDDLEYTFVVSDTALISAEMQEDTLGRNLLVASGIAEGSGTITITATDPDGLTAEMSLATVVDTSGYTRAETVRIGNGSLTLSGFTINTCSPPFINAQGVDGGRYTVHSAHWQSRSDSTAAWTDIDGTQVTTGQLCPYASDTPGDYRLVYQVTAVIIPGLPALEGDYASRNFFTVSSGD